MGIITMVVLLNRASEATVTFSYQHHILKSWQQKQRKNPSISKKLQFPSHQKKSGKKAKCFY